MTIKWQSFPLDGKRFRIQGRRPTSADTKNPGKQGLQEIGTSLAMHPASARGSARRQKERLKMDSETTNLFQRRDTFFGICEAVGQDFGFNPLWLRLAFVAPLFFFPVQTFIGYFALGLVVLASRLIFPAKATAEQPVLSAVETADRPAGKTEGFALAA
ncbi:PspC domain-containing protein [Sphingopyxis sp.]|uniref:PspC domain-containing protein n=1 Tax=Sphingopyxis sp. TaxID=1908224 RepID=UPI002FC71C61